MTKMSKTEETRVLESPPKGTLAVMVLYAAGFTALWVLMYFGTLLARGPVS